MFLPFFLKVVPVGPTSVTTRTGDIRTSSFCSFFFFFDFNIGQVIQSLNKLVDLSIAELPGVGPVTQEDIETALRNTRPSAHLHAHRYDKFNADYGSQIVR